MYAQIAIELDETVTRDVLKTISSRHNGTPLNDAGLTPILEKLDLQGYKQNEISAAYAPPGAEVVYLRMAEKDVFIYVVAKTIPQLTEHCTRTTQRLRKELKVKSLAAGVFTEDNDVKILTGTAVSAPRRFGAALLDKWVSKAVAAVVTAVGALWYVTAMTGGTVASTLQPEGATSMNPATGAVIGLAGTLVGVLFEAIHATSVGKRWAWKEST